MLLFLGVLINYCLKKIRGKIVILHRIYLEVPNKLSFLARKRIKKFTNKLIKASSITN